VAESVEERRECTPMTETPSVAAGMQMIQRSRLADSPPEMSRPRFHDSVVSSSAS
jgi:hypothetical protein